MKRIIIINGPNLNLLGRREPHIYGTETFESHLEHLRKEHETTVALEYFQSNHEGALIDKLHEVGFDYDGIILNAGALSHTSLALADAVGSIETPVVEVHISNIHARESFRHLSQTATKASGSIIGLGLHGYHLAILHLLR